MAASVVARETIFSLRRQIAKIEGRLSETLDPPASEESSEGAMLLRRHGLVARDHGMLVSGALEFDTALGGGLPRAALSEIHSPETRGAGAATGFLLGMAQAAIGIARTPVLWVATTEAFREAGLPYALGIQSLYGIDPARLVVAQTPRLSDALWITEEAARLKGFAAVILEVRGNPGQLDLTATRRLQHRAEEAGRPVFLLRQAARPEATAAPVRLVVSTAPAGLRHTLNDLLPGSIGPPGFLVAISKNRTAPPAHFTLEWNVHERIFQKRRAENPVPVVPASQHRAHLAAKAGSRLAFRYAPAPAPGHQPPGEKHPVHRRLG